jgi:hypothetical protein
VGVSIDQKSVHKLKAGHVEDRTERGPLEGEWADNDRTAKQRQYMRLAY